MGLPGSFHEVGMFLPPARSLGAEWSHCADALLQSTGRRRMVPSGHTLKCTSKKRQACVMVRAFAACVNAVPGVYTIVDS